MGSKLWALVSYFESNIEKYSHVKPRPVKLVTPNKDEYIYEIERKFGLPPIHIYLNDAYDYSIGDYNARPRQLRKGDFILLDKFSHGPDPDVAVAARQDHIGIGDMSILYGALRFRDPSTYRQRQTN